MASTPEGRIKKQIKDWLKTLGRDVWFFMPVSNGMGVHGVPDILCCYKGVFMAIEVKAPGKLNNTTHLQDMQLEGIRDAGGWAVVADSLEMAKELVGAVDRYLATQRRMRA